jgi:glycosyltransferase 2 family protein
MRRGAALRGHIMCEAGISEMAEAGIIHIASKRQRLGIDMEPAKLSWKPNTSVALKMGCGISVLVVLLMWFGVTDILAKLATMKIEFLFAALAILALQFGLSCIRWLLILDRQAIGVSHRDGLAMFGIGTLANLFLVTSLAGMSVRVAMLLRAGGPMSGALASVTVERLAAAVGLLLCASLGFAVAFPALEGKLTGGLGWQADALMMGAAAVLAAVSCVALWIFRPLRHFASKVLAGFIPLTSGLLLVVISVGIVISGFAGMAVLALGMNIEIDPLFFMAIMPAIAFVSALPISIGGWGVREGMMVAGLSLFSVAPDSAVALSISYGLGGLLVALILGVALSFAGSSAFGIRL